MSEWQPIDTAPMDGTEVLVFYRGQRHVASYSAVWHENNLRWCVATPRTGPSEAYTHGTVHDIGAQFFGGVQVTEGPSHWAPLPEPPAVDRTNPDFKTVLKTASGADGETK